MTIMFTAACKIPPNRLTDRLTTACKILPNRLNRLLFEIPVDTEIGGGGSVTVRLNVGPIVSEIDDVSEASESVDGGSGTVEFALVFIAKLVVHIVDVSWLRFCRELFAPIAISKSNVEIVRDVLNCSGIRTSSIEQSIIFSGEFEIIFFSEQV